MHMRNAILQAADHIEQHPECFDFMVIAVPDNCGTPGCALGWIGFFAQLGVGRHSEVADEMQIHSCDFYDRMDKFVGTKWVESPALCAKGLRSYADEFYPAAQLS